MLQLKTPAPDFVLKDQRGREHRLSDYRGQWLLVYFYPKDHTPGCTAEACGLRDHFNSYRQEGLVVIGISADSVDSHQRFAADYQLPFVLLADPQRQVIKQYGAAIGGLTRRISYLIDPSGEIAKVYAKVDAAGHAEQVLRDWQELKTLDS